MKIIITESQYNKAMDWYLTNAFEPHEEKHYGSIFWVKNNEIIAQIEESKFFWIKLDIWNNFSDLFSLQYNEVQSVMEHWLEKHYKLGELTPLRRKYQWLHELKEHYK